MIMIINFLFNITNFCIIIFFFITKLLRSGILFSTAINDELVAKTSNTSYFPSISVILVFKSAFLAKSLVSGIFLSASLTFFSKPDLPVSYVAFKTNPVMSILSTLVNNLLYSVFLTTLFFTTLLSFAKSLGTGVNLSISSLSLQFLSWLNLILVQSC